MTIIRPGHRIPGWGISPQDRTLLDRDAPLYGERKAGARSVAEAIGIAYIGVLIGFPLGVIAALIYHYAS